MAVEGGAWEGGGERRYATLPQAPPLPDWKVMGLKETFSQLSPHLRLSLSRFSLIFSSSSPSPFFSFPGARRPIAHLINDTVRVFIT